MTERKMPPIVEITWLDSHGWSGWRTPEDVEDWIKEGLPKITTLGCLLAEDKDQIIVAQSVTSNFLPLARSTSHTSVDNLMRIPKCCILKRKVLKPGKVTWKA
jgi:hypothetical protein